MLVDPHPIAAIEATYGRVLHPRQVANDARVNSSNVCPPKGPSSSVCGKYQREQLPKYLVSRQGHLPPPAPPKDHP